MGCLRVSSSSCAQCHKTILELLLFILCTAELMDIVAQYKTTLRAFDDDSVIMGRHDFSAFK